MKVVNINKIYLHKACVRSGTYLTTVIYLKLF